MFYQGYEYQEIAAHLRLPIGTVKSRIFTARTKLKERLRQYA
jgi:RNA polymerase sigma-70 factor (ECF subfamily)